MANIKKFLDQDGVSTLWSLVAQEVATVDTKAKKNAEDVAALTTKVNNLKNYDDTDIKAKVKANTDAIATLNSAGEGSVVKTVGDKVAEIVAGADEKYDTLKEISDWILSDTTGAAKMNSDITSLKAAVGDSSVADQVSAALTTAKAYADTKDMTALTTEEIQQIIADTKAGN